MWSGDKTMNAPTHRRLVSIVTLAAAIGGCASGSMKRGEGVDGEILGDEETDGAELPNPDPTFDSQGGADNGEDSDDGGVGDDDDGDDADSDTPVDPDDDGDTGGDDDDVDTDGGEDDAETDDGLGDTGETGGSDEGVTGSDEGGESTGSAGEPLDVSGWTIIQTDTARTFELPEGTVLMPGDSIVIGRLATPTQFENFWGTSLGEHVLYFDGEDDFPVINGLETYHIEDDLGAVVDGPTPAMVSGDNHQRDDAAMAGSDPLAWTVSSQSEATPGLAETAPASAATVVITEISDATGNGNYVYEFVELTYVAP